MSIIIVTDGPILWFAKLWSAAKKYFCDGYILDTGWQAVASRGMWLTTGTFDLSYFPTYRNYCKGVSTTLDPTPSSSRVIHLLDDYVFSMSQCKWESWACHFFLVPASQWAWGCELSLSSQEINLRLKGSFPVYLLSLFRFSLFWESWRYTHDLEGTSKLTSSFLLSFSTSFFFN